MPLVITQLIKTDFRVVSVALKTQKTCLHHLKSAEH